MIKIYFDMDGVLADFVGYVKENNIPYVPQTVRKPGEDKPMWDRIKEIPHFYYRLKPVDGTIGLFNSLRKNYQCEILSAIPKPKWGIENTREDKINWIKDYLGKDVKTNIVYREEKAQYCTGKEAILIDDLPKNINEWTAAGGTGILFTSASDTEKQLKAVLAASDSD